MTVQHGHLGQAVHISPLPLKPKAVKVRESTRWYNSAPPIKGNWIIPFIDDQGKYTGTGVYSWNCDPRSYISTVVATISRRLEVYARRHNHYRYVKSYLNQLVRVSFYYSVTKNDYLMDRILYFLRDLKTRGKLIHKLLLVFMSKRDANFRFVYSHVCSQTKWLLFRASRPRDKSLCTRVFDTAENAEYRDPKIRYRALWIMAQAMRPLSSINVVESTLAAR
jgi:hypothetical protein